MTTGSFGTVPSTSSPSGRSEYALPNLDPAAAERFAGLEALCDPVTVQHLEGVGVTAGWSCLEVGGGGGSVARWLSDRVGGDGHVGRRPAAAS